MFILLLYALQDCGTATNVGRNVAYAMAIVLTSPYVLGYQFPYGSQPEFENKCQLINMRSLQLPCPLAIWNLLFGMAILLNLKSIKVPILDTTLRG